MKSTRNSLSKTPICVASLQLTQPRSVLRAACQNSVVLALFYTTILLELAASAVEWHDVTDYGLCLGKYGAVVERERERDESVATSDGRVPVLLYFERWD